MGSHGFEAVVQTEGPGTFVEVPLDIPALFGRKRVPVRVTVNGYTYRSTIAIYGDRYYLPLNKSVRGKAGVAVGDTVAMAIELDDAPRVVEVPAELAAALNEDGAASGAFDALSYSHRREYAEFVAEAKKPETRARRALKAVEELKER